MGLHRECEEKINGEGGPFVKPNYLEYEKPVVLTYSPSSDSPVTLQ